MFNGTQDNGINREIYSINFDFNFFFSILFLKGKKVYYHKIIIEGDSDYGKEILSVKCITANATENHGIVKRDVLPVGFQEPEYVNTISPDNFSFSKFSIFLQGFRNHNVCYQRSSSACPESWSKARW
jgi:hypothetical protein